jgi:hypothetical protein
MITTTREVGDIKEELKYLELEDLSHLLLQRRSNKHPYNNKNWRESYYFNVTDKKNQLSLITTIGILPNKKRSEGFVIILHKGKIALTKLLISRDIKWHETDRFSLKKLSFKIEGIDWRLGYSSKNCTFNILFQPLNEYHNYPKNSGDFTSLFSEHIEQAGWFQGILSLNGKKMKFGPTYGHRDHSWGIRDWSSIDSYWLFSCSFGNNQAFNLWKGSSQRKPFHAGYFFDSKENLNIVSSKIRSQLVNDKEDPKGCLVLFTDEKGDKHKAQCNVICSVPIPLKGCIVYETIARIKLDNTVGYGLLERHVHDANPLHKIKALNTIRKRKRGGP